MLIRKARRDILCGLEGGRWVPVPSSRRGDLVPMEVGGAMPYLIASGGLGRLELLCVGARFAISG